MNPREAEDSGYAPRTLLRRTIKGLLVGAAVAVPAGARADLNLVPGMTPAQASAASDTQQIYNYFSAQTNLTPDQQALFDTARELVQTSNEQQGSGPTVFSLGLTVQGLRNALQWVAAEELGTPGTMATKTTSGQLSSVAARLSALKFGVTGFNVNMSDSGFGLPDGRTLALAPGGGPPQGGGAGADGSGECLQQAGRLHQRLPRLRQPVALRRGRRL